MRAWGLFASALALAGAATPGSVKDGVDAWQRGDYAAAVRVWQPLADKGDGDAAFDLAQAYKLGRGVPTDLAAAKRYYGVAARAGHMQGAANYGLLLFQDGDRKQALPWIEKASGAGDPRAQYVYGTALFNGDLLPRDWPRAYALMTRAAAAGLPQATTSLAQMDQYMATADKQKGLALAARIASQPMPPIGREPVSAAPPVQIAGAEAGPAPRAAEPVHAPSKPLPVKPILHATATKAGPKPAPASAGGTWQVQLGAYGSSGAAQAAWKTLSGKAAALRALRPSYEKAGAMTRLRAGPLDREGAQKACAAAKAAGGGCFPVAP